MGFLLYYPFILFMVFFREPYHSQWTDSANRMFVQVLLFAVFVVIMNFAEYYKKSANSEVIVE
jgi:hypothetical protein